MKIAGIYKITNIIDKKVYIGSSINLQKRLNQHKNYSKLKTNKYLYNAFAKYGFENFSIEVIECIIPFNSAKELNKYLLQREQYWIDYYKTSTKIYNIIPADRNIKYKLSQETREKISNSQRWKGKNSDKQYSNIYNRRDKYRVVVSFESKVYELGIYNTLEEALSVRDTYCKCNKKEFFELLANRKQQLEERKSSKYYGVRYRKEKQLYLAVIKKDNKEIYLGSSKKETTAALLVNTYLIENNFKLDKLNNINE